jgi:hypothetical protein
LFWLTCTVTTNLVCLEVTSGIFDVEICGELDDEPRMIVSGELDNEPMW